MNDPERERRAKPETDSEMQSSAERTITRLMERIGRGDLPDHFYNLNEYLEYLADELTPHDPAKTDTENAQQRAKKLKELKREAQARGLKEVQIGEHQLLEELLQNIDDEDLIDRLNESQSTDELIALIKSNQKGIKKAVMPVMKLLAYFKKGGNFQSLLNTEKILGLGLLGRAFLSRLPPEGLELLKVWGTEKWTSVEVLQLAPFLVEVVKKPGYLKFSTSHKPEAVDPNIDSNFFVRTDKPTLGAQISTQIPSGSIESDLIILQIRNPVLAQKLMSSMQRVMMQRAPKTPSKKLDDYAFGVLPTDFTAKMRAIEEHANKFRILAKSMSAIGLDKDGMGEDKDPYMMSPTKQEQSTLRSISTIINNKKTNLEQSVSPDKRTTGQQEDLEMWDMAVLFIEKCNDLKEFVSDFYNPIVERSKVKVITLRIWKLHPQYQGQSIDKIPRDVVARVVAELGGEAEVDRLAAIEARGKIEQMLKHLVTTLYTDVIEAGGEPEVAFDAAVSKTVVGWSASAKQMINILSKRLTKLKTGAAGVAKNQDTTLIGNSIFANTYRDMKQEYQYKNESGQSRTVVSSELSYRTESSNKAFAEFANSLEMGFDTFHAVVEGSYTFRYIANVEGKKYFEHLLNPAHKEFIASRTFDHYHAMAGGELTAQIVPTVKMIMMDFFNEREWVIGQELEEEVFGHKKTIYKLVDTFLQDNYPDLSDSTRREVAYASIHQAYAHFQLQQFLSRTRGSIGYQGKLFNDDNAHFAPFRKYYSFGDYESAAGPAKHEGFAKGAMVLPAWYDLNSARWGHQETMGSLPFDNITWTTPYGALIEYSSRDFGHFFTYTDEHFDGTVPKTMLPYNLVDGGSDDKLRGWRQNNKVIGNVSRELYQRVAASDDIELNAAYRNPDHLTTIWKSVENVGVNYVRSMMEVVGKMSVDPTSGIIKNREKFEHLYQFLYRRYFVGEQTDDDKLKNLRAHMLASIPELKGQSLASESAFWSAVEGHATNKKSAGIHQSVLSRVYTLMLAERNPMTFMTLMTSWTTQTGETVGKRLRSKFSDSTSGFYGAGEKFEDVWSQTRNDMIVIQSEARGKVTGAIRENRAKWQKDYASEKNIFGNFTNDRSEVSTDGASRGYIVTEKTIETVLRERYGPSPETEERIRRVKLLQGQILEEMSGTPDVPDYDKVKGYMEKSIKDAFKDVPDNKKPDFAKVIEEKMGVKGIEDETARRAAFEAKYKDRLKSRSDWFIYAWEQGFLGVEPEADYAEDLTVYSNADENHIGRMAGIVQETSVKIKEVLSNPDDELGFQEMVKAFAKDPIKTVDAMAGYLNKFRKIIIRERGPDFSIRYLNYYIGMVVDSAVKDEEFRSGFSWKGFAGVWNDFAESVFGKNKMSLATDRNQVFAARSISAREGQMLVRYMEQKKIINDAGAKILRKRLRASIPDVIWELSPYLAIFFLYTFARKSIIDPLADMAEVDEKRKK